MPKGVAGNEFTTNLTTPAPLNYSKSCSDHNIYHFNLMDTVKANINIEYGVDVENDFKNMF